MKLITKCSLIFGFAFVLSACTDLEENLNEDLTRQEAEAFLNANTDVSALLQAAYDGVRGYQSQEFFWAAQEHTSDEVIGPTRGPDWDDNGIWRVLHDHTWGADHNFLEQTFNQLLQVVFTTTNILTFETTASEEAQARFLRAFVMLSLVDGWGQVPFRDAGGNLLEPPTVLSGQEAVDFVIAETEAIISDLPDGPATVANKDAARVLLMKAYLNKGAFANRENPVFDAGDMNQVIARADEIISSGQYALAENYFDNFAPNNDVISTENIFTGENIGGANAGNVASRWFCTLHYNQNPSGWNGFTTIADFYNKFEEDDARASADYPGMTDISGINAGFLVGQQVDGDGNALEDRRGNPLAFTEEVSIIETDDDLEITGVRVVKYPIDYVNGQVADNDYVFYRYADVLLMKAEALLRTGNAGEALAIVNEIRTQRGVEPFAELTLDNLIDERGRELYWEGHRRTDLIRFGKFLEAWDEKPASGPERLMFAIPPTALAVNPNLTQNPGY
jgi:starch-binding outer membrane protein, SusD/RagB family